MEERCKGKSCPICWAEEFKKVNSPRYDEYTVDECMSFCGLPQATYFASPEKLYGTEYCVINRRNVPW